MQYEMNYEYMLNNLLKECLSFFHHNIHKKNNNNT